MKKRISGIKAKNTLAFAASAIGAISALTHTSQAAVTFSTAVTISGDTDVRTDGSLVQATTWGSTQTVNGVTFTSTTGASDVGIIDFTSGFNTANSTAFTSASAPFSALSTAYKGMLVGAVWRNSAGTATFDLTGLTNGATYLLQVWVSDPRSLASGRTQTINGTAMDYNSTDAEGGLGQYVTASFTATGTTETITFNSTTAAQMNAVQLRLIPEPSSSVLLVLGCLALALRRKR